MLAAAALARPRAGYPDDEILYTGVKKVNIAPADSFAVPSELSSSIRTAVDVAPNNYIKLLHWRYPFPLGLWVYNNWPNPDRLPALAHEKLVEEPVLVSDVRPEVRTHMIEHFLTTTATSAARPPTGWCRGKTAKKPR